MSQIMTNMMDAYSYNGTVPEEMLRESALDALITGIPKSIIFIVVSMAVGVASLSFCPRSVSVAFTFFLSFVIGRAAAGCFDREAIEDVMDDYTWMSLGYRELVFVLTPSLIFEAAYSLEVHDFRKYQYQIFVLSFLCYCINAGIYGLVIFLQMPIVYSIIGVGTASWPLMTCLQFGAMASPLDPNSASTMLHYVGVPHRLYVLIKGDSMLSNVAAIIAVNLFDAVLHPGSTNPEIGAVFYIVGFFVSILIGYVIGRIAALVLRSLSTDPVRENAFLVAFVYCTFGICKKFGAGVLGTFVFALALNANRKWMNREQFEMNKRIWTTLAYYSRCIIVILTGMTSSIYFERSYLAHAIFGYVFSVLSRACALIICTPIIRLVSGGRYPVQYSCFMMWASVRGAISMILSWRTFESREIFVEHLSDETKIQDLAMWLISTTVALGHLVQGCSIGWFGRKLGLAGISRADRDHLNEFVIRLNNRIKEKIAVRKALPRYAEADWSKIERNASLRLENQKVLAVDSIRSAQPRADAEENEWHARDALQRVYDVELSNMSHFGSLSRGLRRVQQAVAEATELHSRIRVEVLIQDRQPFSIWRRLCPSGGWNPGWVKMLLGDRRMLWTDFWRLICCAVSTVQAAALVVTLYEVGKDGVSNHGMFVSGLFALFSSVEFVLRLWMHRKQMRWIYVQGNNALDWLYMATGPCHLISLALHIFVYHSCKGGNSLNFKIGLVAGCPKEIRYALLGISAIFWLNVPAGILLLIRILCFELGHHWQSADEQCFEILNALIALSSRAIEELKEGELKDVAYELRQRLIKENEAIKRDSHGKLNELYKRRGGSDVFVAIKTRRVAYDLLFDAAQYFQTAKQCGELNDSEYKMTTDAIARLRNKVQQWTVEKCRKEPSRKIQ